MSLLDGAIIVPRDSQAAALCSGPTLRLGTGKHAGLDGTTLTITQKGTVQQLEAAVDYVAIQTPDEIGRWREALGLVADADRPFAGTTIVAEDASPDSCLSLILLARRLNGGTVPEKWISAARRWELGFTDGAIKQSWGPLHNALVHALLDPLDFAESLPVALREGVAYVAALIDAPEDLDPHALPTDVPNLPLHYLARARLLQEEISFRSLRDQALRVQLALPFRELKRARLIDAIFFSEVRLEGALKVFLRSDRESWSREGYVFNGLFRPAAAGSGNDISFSVDPAANVSLEPLWRELERREDTAWNGDRPRKNPRQEMLDRKTAWRDGLTPSDEPWWDDHGKYTLIAAPRSQGGVPGTKLSWDEALDAVWHCFAPGGELEVRVRGDEAAKFRPLAPGASASDRTLIPGTSIHIIDWVYADVGGAQLVTWCPTVESQLASLLNDGAPAKILSLPDRSCFDVLRIGRGIVLVTEKGVLMLGQDSDLLFPADELRREATELATTLAVARALASKVKAARSLALKAIQSGSGGDRRRALTSVYKVQLEARRAWPAEPATGGGPIGLFRDACEGRWRARHLFAKVLEEAKELEAMITSSTESRINSLVSGVAIYGLPAALFGNVLGVAFSPMARGNGDGWEWLKIAWMAVAAFLVLLAILCIAILLVTWWNRRQWRGELTLESEGESATGEAESAPESEPQASMQGTGT